MQRLISSNMFQEVWLTWGKATYYYGLVPGVFGIGLAYSGECTLNPATLFAKIFVQ